MPNDGWPLEPALVALTMGVGDYLMALPSVRAMAELFEGRLSFVCRSEVRDFFREVPLKRLVPVHVYPAVGLIQPYGYLPGDMVPEEALYTGYDLLVMIDSLRPVSRLFMDLLPPDVPWIGRFSGFDVVIPRRFGIHAMEGFFDLPRWLRPELRIEDFAAPPVFRPSVTAWAKQLRAALAPPPHKVLTVHDDTKVEKVWSPEALAGVLDEFQERHPEFVVFVVGVEDLGL